MKNSRTLSRYYGLILFILFVSVFFTQAKIVPPRDYTVAGVIGASYENGQASPNHPVFPYLWYMGGAYKTWVDYIAFFQVHKYHWLNYAYGGETSTQGLEQLSRLLAHTVAFDANGQPYCNLSVLVIGNWGNDYVWYPYDQQIVDTLIQNVQIQINTALNSGVEKVIVLGLPAWEDLDLDYFISLMPPGALPGHIDEAGYNQVKEQFNAAFAGSNAGHIFLNPWEKFVTLDGAHPSDKTSRRAAIKIAAATRK